MKADSVQLENNMNKIYFDGCSYTFGQSLELYCNDLSLFDKNRMSKYILNENDLEFIKKNRWSSIVSNHLNLKEINSAESGKSNGEILRDLIKFINNNDIKTVEYCIIQLTHFDRFYSKKAGKWNINQGIESLMEDKFLTEKEIYYMIENIEDIQLDYYLKIVNLFKKYPNKLKILFHSNEWEDILTKEQIENYGISINGEYMIRRWAENNNIFINQQDIFKKNPATDYDTHLSIEGHQILAQEIIKQL